MEFDKKVVIVTGAGGRRGTGRGIALWFAREGADVALVDIERPADLHPPDEVAAGWKGIESVAREIREIGRSAVPLYCDIRDSARVQGMVDETVAKLGRIDIIVNNARAIIGPSDLVVDMKDEEWDSVMGVNATGTFNCCRAVARYFLDAGVKGQIINISSTAGKQGFRGRAAYCASKFAIIGLTQALALEMAPHGVRVNAVCPGLIDSGRFSIREKIGAEREGISYEEFERRRIERLSKDIPTGRAATPDDIAAMVVFLASEKAGQITGQSFNVNGGEIMH